MHFLLFSLHAKPYSRCPFSLKRNPVVAAKYSLQEAIFPISLLESFFDDIPSITR